MQLSFDMINYTKENTTFDLCLNSQTHTLSIYNKKDQTLFTQKFSLDQYVQIKDALVSARSITTFIADYLS